MVENVYPLWSVTQLCHILNRDHQELLHYGRQLRYYHRKLVNTYMFGSFFADFVTYFNTTDLTSTPSQHQTHDKLNWPWKCYNSYVSAPFV